MTKTKKVLIAACIFIVAGIICLVIGMMTGGRAGFYVDGSGIHTVAKGNKLKEASVLEKTKLEAFDSLSILAENADIMVIPSDGYYLEYRVIGGGTKPEYKVEKNKLTFSENPKHHMFFTYFDFSIQGAADDDCYIKLYVPTDKVLKTVELINEDGDITLSEVQADSVTLKNAGGNIESGNITASQCKISTEDGAISLEELNADHIKIENEYGDIAAQTLQGSKGEISMNDGEAKIKTVDMEMFTLKNEYGNVDITTLNSEYANITMDDGDFLSGVGEISSLSINNKYGNVTLNLSEPLEQYGLTLHTESGTILLPDNSTIQSGDDETSYVSKNKTGKKIKVECEDGKIMLRNQLSQ